MEQIISIFLVVALFMVSCTSYQNTQNVPEDKVLQTVPVTELITTSAETADIIIKNFAFSPNVLNIHAGITIVWTNQDSALHTIKFDDFESDRISNGGSYEHKFESVGTYDYICGLHPSMKGQIIVE